MPDYEAVLRQRWQDACVLPDTAKQIEKEADLSSLLQEGNKGEHLKKLYNYDKFIVESDRIYRQWWIMGKRIHPRWALVSRRTKKAEKAPPCKQATVWYNGLICHTQHRLTSVAFLTLPVLWRKLKQRGSPANLDGIINPLRSSPRSHRLEKQPGTKQLPKQTTKPSCQQPEAGRTWLIPSN
jgi:hypothetical protein